MKPVRIVVADDHEVVRRGLRAILETREGWEVTGEAATGREAVEQAKQLKPDVVVLDLVMPEMNGLDATRRILKAVPTAEVLILTMHEPEHLMHEVLTAGARGYLLKSDAGRELVAAVDALSRHVPAFTSRVANALLAAYLKNDGHERGADRRQGRLTPREREIVQLLAEGKTNKEVAAALDIAVKTVEAHRSNVMHKLGLHSLSEIVHYAVRNKIVHV